MLSENDEGLYRLRTEHREIIPVAGGIENFHVPSRLKKQMRRWNYTVSTNQCFDQVLETCSLLRTGQVEDERWIRDHTKRILRELNLRGNAHSLEVWSDRKLVGGALILQTGALVVSLSLFSHQSGAGSAAFVELQARLVKAGFLMHDAVTPSNISRFFGGRLIRFQEDFVLRRRAAGRGLAFPVAPAMLSAEDFFQPPDRRGQSDGRTFPRQKHYAPEGGQ